MSSPRHAVALAEMIEEVALSVRINARGNAGRDAQQLRRLADVLEGRV